MGAVDPTSSFKKMRSDTEMSPRVKTISGGGHKERICSKCARSIELWKSEKRSTRSGVVLAGGR